MKFIAYSDKNLTIPGVSVYATAVKHGNETIGHELIAFDPTGDHQVANPDQSIAEPGLAVGGK